MKHTKKISLVLIGTLTAISLSACDSPSVYNSRRDDEKDLDRMAKYQRFYLEIQAKLQEA